MKIMRIKQQDGSLVDVPMGKGADGKSAYEYAQDGGYEGTESEFRAKLAVPFITPEMYGAKGDGVTDDSVAIQNAINAAGNQYTVYLSNKTYRINTGLVISTKSAQFVCDGVIKYAGEGSTITIATPEGTYMTRVSVYVNRIESPNATAIKLDATGGSMDMARVEVNTIYRSKIGLHLLGGQGQEGGFIMYSTFRIGELQATDIGILAEAGDVPDGNFVNENIYYLGRICGECAIGIKLVKSCSNRFLQGAFEGVNDSGTSIWLENSGGNTIRNFRWAENYGATRIKFIGDCRNNDFEGSGMCLEEVDISELGDIGGFSNILRSPYIASGKGGHRAGYIALVNKKWGMTYVPDYHESNYLVLKSDTYPDNVIERINCTIYTDFWCDAEDLDGLTFTLGSFYNGYVSLARGCPITFLFGTDHGKIKIEDSRGDTVLDNSTGKYAGKTVSVKWEGFSLKSGKDVWAINIQGESYATEKFVRETVGSTKVSLDALEQDITFSDNIFGLVSESNGGNKYRVVVTDSGFVTSVPVSDINQIPLSIDTDGSVFNGTGYASNMRINSSGVAVESTGCCITGYIRVSDGDALLMTGWDITDISYNANGNIISVFDENFNYLGMFNAKDSRYGIFNTTFADYGLNSIIKIEDGNSWVVPVGANIKYVRVGAANRNPSRDNLSIIINSVNDGFTPVIESVNGKTGVVQLNAEDVGALPSNTKIPSKTSDLTNDSGFLTAVPVQSVNNKTGEISLSASDVGALASENHTTKNLVVTYDDGTSETIKLVVAK